MSEVCDRQAPTTAVFEEALQGERGRQLSESCQPKYSGRVHEKHSQLAKCIDSFGLVLSFHLSSVTLLSRHDFVSLILHLCPTDQQYADSDDQTLSEVEIQLVAL